MLSTYNNVQFQMFRIEQELERMQANESEEQ